VKTVSKFYIIVLVRLGSCKTGTSSWYIFSPADTCLLKVGGTLI
jgi:hypothetical protein